MLFALRGVADLVIDRVLVRDADFDAAAVLVLRALVLPADALFVVA